MPDRDPPRTPRDRLVDEIERQTRRMTVESERLAHEFAARHDLHSTDFQALVHVMDAEGRGNPLTPGELGQALSLSSGATTAVIDRLERAGHVRRDRDPSDRRKVHLRWAEHGMAVAQDFFGGLLPLRENVMGPMSEADLDVVRRFLASMSDGIAAYRRTLETASPPPPRPLPPAATSG